MRSSKDGTSIDKRTTITFKNSVNKQKMAQVFGLTGGIACGKSTVSSLLRSHGAAVIDADQLARNVVIPGSEGLAAVTNVFGDSILHSDGSLDRQALGGVVFADPEMRRTLESLLHPRIAKESAVAISRHIAAGVDVIIYDAALLVEQGRQRDFAGLIVVACTPKVQRERLAHRDGLDAEAVTARLASQLPIEDKVAAADFVVWNDGSRAELTPRIEHLFLQLTGHSLAER